MKNLFYLLFVLLGFTLIFSSCAKEEMLEIESVTEAPTHLTYARGDNCPTTGTPLGTVDLMAGQNIDMGDIIFSISADGLYLVIEFDGVEQSGWAVGTTHIYAGDEAGVPTSGGGNPQNGQFPYGTDNDINLADILAAINLTGSYDSDFTYNILLTDILSADPTTSSDPVCFVVLVHAEVHEISYDPTNSNGPATSTQSQTAWASGMPFSRGKNGKKGGNWSMYNEFCL